MSFNDQWHHWHETDKLKYDAHTHRHMNIHIVDIDIDKNDAVMNSYGFNEINE